MTERRPTPGELLRWGQSLAFVGSWNEACELLREAVEVTPSNLEAWTSLVETLFRAGRLSEAEAAAEGLLVRAPDDAYALVLRAAIVARTDADRALPLAEDAARRAPERAGTWAILAEIYAKLGEPHPAIAAAQRAVAANDQWYSGHVLLADCLAAIGRFEEAAVELDRASTLVPDSVNLRMRRAQMLLRAGRRRDAVEVLVAGVRAQPESRELRSALAKAADPGGADRRVSLGFLLLLFTAGPIGGLLQTVGAPQGVAVGVGFGVAGVLSGSIFVRELFRRKRLVDGDETRALIRSVLREREAPRARRMAIFLLSVALFICLSVALIGLAALASAARTLGDAIVVAFVERPNVTVASIASGLAVAVKFTDVLLAPAIVTDCETGVIVTPDFVGVTVYVPLTTPLKA